MRRYLFYNHSNKKIKQFIDQIKLQNKESFWETASFEEVFPSQLTPVCLYDEKKAILIPVLMKWGIARFDQKKLIINARSESVDQKYTFKKAYQKRRCVVVASGYFEWEKDSKQKYFFQNNSNSEIYMAALYNFNEEVGEFVILTQEAQGECAKIHHRTPIILNEEEAILYCKNNPSGLIENNKFTLKTEAIQKTLF